MTDTPDNGGETISPPHNASSAPLERKKSSFARMKDFFSKHPLLSLAIGLGILAIGAMIGVIGLILYVFHRIGHSMGGEVAIVIAIAAIAIVLFLINLFTIRIIKMFWRMMSKELSNEEESSDKAKASPWRPILFLLFLAILVVTAVMLDERFGHKAGAGANNPAAITHPNFVPGKVCAATQVISYANADISDAQETFTIKLTEGCYADWVLPPQYWKDYLVQLSENPGDYASLWCNDQREPYPIVESYQRGVLYAQMLHDRCHAPGQLTNEFRFQGHGTVTFIMTQRRPIIRVTDEGFPAS
jgi:NADH:ubiquinone oxidoreductase subunit 5 (subunit L)/multisubunit Na+/H+ antiporter MnhA subunit